MTRRFTRTLALLGCSLAFLALPTGCTRNNAAKPAASTESSSAVVNEPVSAAPETPTEAAPASPVSKPATMSANVIVPKSGSSLRKELLAAARERLRTAKQFIVMQLYAQGDVAVGDFRPVGSPASARRIVAFRRTGGTWTAVWDGPYSKNARKDLAANVPGVSQQLLARIVTTLSAPAAETASIVMGAKAAGLAAAKGQASPELGTLSVISVKTAKDSKGTWWASVVVHPSAPGNENLPVYLHRVGTTWKVVDLGTGIEPGSDDRFPPEVRGKL